MYNFLSHKIAAIAVLSAVAGLAGAATTTPAATTPNGFLPLTYAQLQSFNGDWTKKHDALPMGVPNGYDWYGKPAVHQWNNPGTFLATTGWGQAFYMNGAKASNDVVQIRNFQTLICYGAQHKWVLLQQGAIDGAQYKADFQANISLPAPLFVKQDAQASAGFILGSAFHFWPLMGRATIPDPKTICGFVVVMEGRAALPPVASTTTAAAIAAAKAADAITPTTFLLGAGLDYWSTKTAAWDNYKTNSDLGVGRLRAVSKDWAWFGLSSASDADLLNLVQNGYDLGVFK